MRANGSTHVTVHANDLDGSVRFYTELFEMEEIHALDFLSPVRWLLVGDLQLHLLRAMTPRRGLTTSG